MSYIYCFCLCSRHFPLCLTSITAHNPPASLDISGSGRQTPLHEAIINGQLETATALIQEYGCDATISNAQGLNALHLAAANVKGDDVADFLSLLLRTDISLDSITSDSRTAIHIASSAGNIRFVEGILANAVTTGLVEALDGLGRTALHIAARDGSQGVLDVLLKYQPSLRSVSDADSRMPIHLASLNGNLDCVMSLSVDDNWNHLGYMARTPLLEASMQGHLAVVSFLLEKGSSIDAEDSSGYTSLILALANKHIEVANTLLDRGADPAKGGELDGFTSLYAAVESGDETIVSRIIGAGHGALVLRKLTAQGRTPFFQAVVQGSQYMVNLFLTNGYDGSRLVDTYGRLCIHDAALLGHDHILRQLLDLHPDLLTALDNSRIDLLEYAAAGGNIDVISHLMTSGLETDGLHRGMCTPLFRSIFAGMLTAADHFLRHGADRAAITTLPYGHSLLHAASKFPRITSLLLAAGVNPHLGDARGLMASEFADPHVRQRIEWFLESSPQFDAGGRSSEPVTPRNKLVCDTLDWIIHPPEPFQRMKDFMFDYRSDCIKSLLQILTLYTTQESVAERRMLQIEIASLSGAGHPLGSQACAICRAELLSETRYACLQCSDVILCDLCHKDYTAEDGDANGNRVKGLRVLQDLETRVYAMRYIAQAAHDYTEIFFGAIFHLKWAGIYEELLDPLQKRFEDWQEKYNNSQQLSLVDKPGMEFLAIVDDTAKKWSLGLSEAIPPGWLLATEKALQENLKNHPVDKELAYFLCEGHEFVEVPHISNLLETERSMFDQNSMLGEAYLHRNARTSDG